MYNAQEFVDSHEANVNLSIDGAEYNLNTLEVVIPGIFTQRFDFAEVNKELGRIWIYERDDVPLAWWNIELLEGYSPNP